MKINKWTLGLAAVGVVSLSSVPREQTEDGSFRLPERNIMDIPKDKNYPGDSVQCNNCGGHGCATCQDKGWLAPSNHPDGRKCEREGCGNPIPPNQVAVYCTNECAYKDA